MPFPLLAAALALSTPCADATRPWIAEVLYDAAGDDTGREYVELFWPGPGTRPLAGARLESGDGSAPGRWTLRWTGGANDTLRAGARFVVGGALVTPPVDAVATLDLQNGPDAVRLVWPDGAVETVGWGAHDFAEYFCGEPAADPPSGRSLARVPDDAHRGSNALDFEAADPSPGRANRAGRDVALRAGSLSFAPESPPPASAARARVTLRNAGADTLAHGAVSVTLSARRAEGGETRALGAAALDAALAPGDSAALDVAFEAPEAGKWRALALARADGDDKSGANDADSAAVRVGPPPVELSEIQFHPDDGGGEWIELRARESFDLARLRVSDRGGAVARLAEPLVLPAESLAVWCQDRAAFLARRPGLDTARVRGVAGSWPALNNADDDSGVADVLTLVEDDGTPVERVPYSAAGVPKGVPIERLDGLWRPALDPLGSPLAPARPPRADRGAVRARTRTRPRGRARAGHGSLPFARATIRVGAYDLDGRRVGGVLAEFAGGARGERDVALEALPPGTYALAFEARGDDGGAAIVEAHALRVGRSAP